MKVRVFVPATTANLGAGFDVFGLAVELHNEFYIENAEKFEIIFENGHGELPATKDNLFYQSFTYLFKKIGKKVPQVKIRMNIQVSLGKGFGSSATAVIGGLVAANAFLKYKFSKEELLPFAVELERGNHLDNIAPALLGGLVICSTHNKKISHVQIPFPTDIKAVYFIPDFIMDTVTGRKLMPTHYAKEDVVFNTSRVALFLAAIQAKQYDLLQIAMQDKIHQPTRAKIFPLMPQLIAAANEAGALGTSLSGGGSAIIALADKNFKEIGDAMKHVAEKHGVTGISKQLEVSNKGVFVSYVDN